MLTKEQCRAGRGLLGLSQKVLSAKSKVNARTILDFEAGKRSPNPATLLVLRQTLEDAGVEFIPENGGGASVRLKKV